MACNIPLSSSGEFFEFYHFLIENVSDILLDFSEITALHELALIKWLRLKFKESAKENRNMSGEMIDKLVFLSRQFWQPTSVMHKPLIHLYLLEIFRH
jgi:hypothetical protein